MWLVKFLGRAAEGKQVAVTLGGHGVPGRDTERTGDRGDRTPNAEADLRSKQGESKGEGGRSARDDSGSRCGTALSMSDANAGATLGGATLFSGHPRAGRNGLLGSH